MGLRIHAKQEYLRLYGTEAQKHGVKGLKILANQSLELPNGLTIEYRVTDASREIIARGQGFQRRESVAINDIYEIGVGGGFRKRELAPKKPAKEKPESSPPGRFLGPPPAWVDDCIE